MEKKKRKSGNRITQKVIFNFKKSKTRENEGERGGDRMFPFKGLSLFRAQLWQELNEFEHLANGSDGVSAIEIDRSNDGFKCISEYLV